MQKPAKASVMLLERHFGGLWDECALREALTWWSNETLCLADAETHSAIQNLREEICERIRHGCQTTEAHGETPNLEIKAGLQELDEVERLGGDIGSVSVHASYNEVDLALVQETPGLFGIGVRERNQEAVTHETDADGEDAFDDEDPAVDVR
jgi:hypothetical protein